MKKKIYLICLFLFSLMMVKMMGPQSNLSVVAAEKPTVKVEMYNTIRNSTSNTISPHFKLTNTGTEPITLSDLKIRYYYSIDGEHPQNFWCDWASIGASNVTGNFVKNVDINKGADYYLEVGFTNTAGQLAPGSNIQIQTRFSKKDWSNYIQTNDYSFNKNATTYTEWNKVAVNFTSTGSVKKEDLQQVAFAPPAEPSVEILTYSGNPTTTINTLSPRFKVINNGSSRIALSQLKIRYYYTMEGNRAQEFHCDWATIQTDYITGEFVPVTAQCSDVNYYCEIGFTSDAGFLEAGASIEIHTRINKDDWLDYDQSNDYSFVSSTGNQYLPTEKTPVFVGETLISGVLPQSKVSGVTLSSSAIALTVEETVQLTPTIVPLDATNRNVTWTSSDTSIATVTSNGIIKGISPGIAVITVTTQEGNFQAQCEVTVNSPQLKGYLRGIVKDAVSQQIIKDVTLQVENVVNGSPAIVASAVSKEDGTYEIPLPPGNYRVTVMKEAYITLKNFILINAGETIYNPELRLVSNDYNGMGIVQGKITNALNDQGIENLTIRFRSGINSKDGEVVATAKTDVDGNYSINLNAGNYTGEVSGNGFITGLYRLAGKLQPIKVYLSHQR